MGLAVPASSSLRSAPVTLLMMLLMHDVDTKVRVVKGWGVWGVMSGAAYAQQVGAWLSLPQPDWSVDQGMSCC